MTSYRTTCESCLEEISASARYCPRCGSKQPWIGEDRQIETDGGSDLSRFGFVIEDDVDEDDVDEDTPTDPIDAVDDPDLKKCRDCGEPKPSVFIRDPVAPGVEICASCALARLEEDDQ